MNKKFIILFAFVILVEAISSMSSVESKSISNAKCDSGVETFDLVLLLPSGPSKLDVTLSKDQDELTATCDLKPLNPDIPNDSDMIASDSEIPSTEIEKNNEEEEDSDMASSDSDEVGTLDGNDASVIYECTLDGSPKEGSYTITDVKGADITNLESLTVELLSCDSDSSNEISSEDLSNTINESYEDLLSNEADLSDTTLSVEIDRGKSDIRLSFRQVSGFNLNAFTFNFFGLTTKDIPADFSFIFMIYYITGTGKGDKKVEATCTIKNPVTLSGSPMAQADFTCTFPETEGLVSIEIASCDGVAGLPFFDYTLLNPKLTDDGIKSGALKDKSNMPIPSFAKVDMNSFNFDSISEGTFKFKLTVDSLPTEIKPDQTFVLFFNGIKFGFTIISIEGTVLSFDVKIFGEINDQPIAFEQTVVTINGIEAFVIPGFLTEERITTKGLPVEPENSDNKEGSSDNEDTDEQSSEETAQSSDEEKTDESAGQDSDSSDNGGEDSTEPAETNRSSSTDLDEQISDDPKFEEAEKRLEIFITFRQINGFTFVPGTISFNFFALITQTLKTPYEITLLFNLITTEGMEEDPREIQCQLVETVEVNDGETKQATFKCEKTGLDKSIIYTGLRLISSEDIAGIPYDDETLLNPALTDEAIKNGDLKDAKDSVVPPSFEFEKLDTQKCSEDGKFLLTGKLDKETTIANKFTIPLTYPPNVVITCTFGTDGIQCIADEQLVGSVMIEQQVIKEGADELFILKKVKQEDINCENGLKVQAEEKLKVDISFRQVSHIERKAGGNGLRFFFAGFVNKDLAKAYTVNMKVIVIIKEQKVEKEAKCTLEEEVKVTKGKETQADFNCDLDLAADEEVKPENLTVSTNNENIGGCEELTNEELSPSLTQEAIDEKSELPLSQVLDYQVEENKEKVPPTFTINSMDFKKCENKGKIKIEGQFSEEITEEMTFELPLTFPKTKVKCTVEEAQANTNVNITCKMQKVKGGLKFTELLVEPRLLKKKRMEMFYVQQKKHTLNEEETCQDYNEIKKERAKKRKKADFTFLQLGRPSGFSGLFFLALTKKMFTGTFTTLTIQVTITIEQSRRRRNLNTLELDKPTSVKCEPKASTDKSVALNCKSDENLVPVSSELEGDDIYNIGGAPDEITVDKNPNPDYSKLDNLKNFDNLASVNITDLDSSNCAKTGEYTIKGVYEGELADNENIMIPFDTPDSSGLCSMKVDSSNKNLTLTCQNTDYFDVSEVMLSNKMVYVNESTPLFKITNDYTARNQFSCAISDKSLIVPTQAPNGTSDSGDDSDTTIDGDSSRTRYRKDSSNGLGGGAIAGIVIACVVVVGIVAALIILTKNGTFASKSAVTATSIDNNSTVNGFKMDEQNPNMV